nr:hypothetical protein [Lachnospiraceae bacterium]
MQISDLMNTYQNMLSQPTKTAAEGNKGVEQLVSTLSKLQPGQIFEGTVNFVKGQQVLLGLSSGQNITAKLDKGMSLMQGESVFFEVKANDGKTINIRPVSIGGGKGNPAISGALKAAGLPLTENSMKMVDDMMKGKMSIDSHSLQSMSRELAMHPGADVSDVVTLKNLNIPVTDEMLNQLHNYKQNEGALLGGMNELATAIDAAVSGAGEAVPSEAAAFTNDVISIIYPGEEFTPEDSAKIDQLIKEFKSATADSAAGEGQKDMLMQASAKGEMPSEQQMTLGKETAVISD